MNQREDSLLKTITSIGVVELVEINFVHRNCEIQIIIDSQFGNKGYAKKHLKWQLIMPF